MASLLAASEALRERHSHGLRELYQRSAQSTQRTPAQHEKIQKINLPPLVYFDDTGITSHGSTSEDPVKASLQEMLLNLQLQQQKTDWAIQSFLDASSMVRREEEIKARQTRTDDEVRSLSSQVASLKADKAAMQEEWAKAQEAWVKESKKNEQQVEKFLAEMASLKKLLALTRTEVVESKQSKTDTDEKVRCLSAEVNALQTSRKQLELRADIIETRYIVDMVKQKRAATGAILSSVERGEASVSSKGTENAASGSPKLIWTGCPLDLSTTTSSFILPYCQASDYVGILKTVNR